MLRNVDLTVARPGDHRAGRKLHELARDLFGLRSLDDPCLDSLLERVGFKAQRAGGLVRPVPAGQGYGFPPTFFGQPGMGAAAATHDH